jgi:thiol:disulfide interchange protein
MGDLSARNGSGAASSKGRGFKARACIQTPANLSKEPEVFMPVQFTKDVDAAFEQARQQNKPVLLDFSAAPA